jgi:UDP-N-acetylmuramate--alanine ligase
MIDIFSAKNIHFTGIKGVGMTATALCAQDLGAIVSGSDLKESFDTDKVLASREIKAKVGFGLDSIDPDMDLLVYTGAHGGSNNPQVKYAKNNGISAISQAEAVGQLMSKKIGFSVCGVGGKTTVSAIMATVLKHTDKNPSYLVGVARIGGLEYPGRYNLDSLCFVAEADEYATSPGIDNTPRFMFQSPKYIICTNILHDHPDVYQDINQVKEAYFKFFQKLPSDGLLVINGDCQNSLDTSKDIQTKKILVGLNENNTFRITHTSIIDGQQHITVLSNNLTHNLVINVPGIYNAKNAVMAYATLLHYGLGEEVIKKGLLEFKGTNRRFDRITEQNGIIYYDDYAHHPEEIKATLRAAKNWLPDKKIIAVFQPHTYSRTKMFLDEFAKSFDDADQVIITDIFPSAREKPDPSISAKILASKISEIHPYASYISSSDLVKYLKENQKSGDVIFTLGAGDVYKIHPQLIS